MMRPTCFLIDDDEDEQELFQTAIREVDETFTFVGVQDSEKALSILGAGTVVPKHIFLDINMPIMSGSECLSELKKIPHLQEVPIYIYTTSANREARQQYLLNGARQVLIKPCRMEDIIGLLKILLGGENAVQSVS
jgi:CheY-like chemotaxis protein